MKAREIALLSLMDVERRNMKSEQALNHYFAQHTPPKRERALATELLNGVLRWQGKIDTIIKSVYHHNLEKSAPQLRNILRIGIYQMHFLDKIPDWAAVSECVKLARKYKGQHISRIANGVLRKAAPETVGSWESIISTLPEDDRAAAELSHPAWMLKRWNERFGKETTERICTANNTPPLIGLRINRLKTDPQTMRKALRDARVEWLETGMEHYVLTSDFHACEPFINLGLLTVQNPTQALPCLLLDPRKQETILDLCAAPGGKSTCMGELMQNTGSIVALDLYANKCEKIASRAKVIGLGNLTTAVADACSYVPPEPVHKILLDVPCSGTGVLGGKPELRWRLSPEKIQELSALQARLLDHAAEILPDGGTLVYATCSIEHEENSDQVQRFLEKHPEFAPAPLPADLPEAFVPLEGKPGAYLTLQGNRTGFDGGFAQRLEKHAL